MHYLDTTNSLRTVRNAGHLGWGRTLVRGARWASVVALALLLWASAASDARAQSYPQTNCPAGQIPAFSGGGCVSTTQNASISGYGLPSQGSNLPESGKNGAPAIQRCNGTPTPFGQPCPGTVIPTATTTGQYAGATSSASNPYGISIALAPSTSAVTIAPPVPYTPPASSTNSGTSAAATSTVASTPPANPTAALQGLLGDWYTGWLGYAANTLNWSDAQTTLITSYFASVTPCTGGQKDTCQAFVYQQLQVWLNPPSAQPAGGS